MSLHLLHRAVVHWQAAQNHVHYQRGFAQLVSEQRLCVLLEVILMIPKCIYF